MVEWQWPPAIVGAKRIASKCSKMEVGAEVNRETEMDVGGTCVCYDR